MGSRMRVIKFSIVLFIAAGIFLMLFPACSKGETELIVAGSTSVQPYAEILAEEFALVHTEPAAEPKGRGSPPVGTVEIQGGGSSAGIAAAESGTADIGMSSRYLKEKEELQGLKEVTIAIDGLAVIVHKDNPVSNLGVEQIQKIYTSDNAARINNWKELGGRDAKIHIITREEGSGTRSAFEEQIMKEEWITPKAIVLNSNGSIGQQVELDPDAIGFISLGLVKEYNVKAVNLDGITPTHANVANGSYLLSRPFLFVTKGVSTGKARQFIDFIL